MEYIVYVDSNNRDQILWPDSNSYTLHLTTPILNIEEVELVSAQLPDLVVSQFVTLDIAELRTPSHLTADALTPFGHDKTNEQFHIKYCHANIKRF